MSTSETSSPRLSPSDQGAECEYFDNTDDEFEPTPYKSRHVAGIAGPTIAAIHTEQQRVNTLQRGDGTPAGSQPLSDTPVVHPLGAAPPADEFPAQPPGSWAPPRGHRDQQRLPRGTPAQPPGSWVRSWAPPPQRDQQRLPARSLDQPQGSWVPVDRPASRPQKGGADDVNSHAEVPAHGRGQSLRLMAPVHPPSPLWHSCRGGDAPVTSLTINSIPFQIRQSQVRELIDRTGFAVRYDYLFVPCNADKTNQGVAYVNFCTPQDAEEFFSAWHGARVVCASGDAPVLSVAVSVDQGFEACIQEWTVAKMLSLDDPDLRPFIAGMS